MSKIRTSCQQFRESVLLSEDGSCDKKNEDHAKSCEDCRHFLESLNKMQQGLKDYFQYNHITPSVKITIPTNFQQKTLIRNEGGGWNKLINFFKIYQCKWIFASVLCILVIAGIYSFSENFRADSDKLVVLEIIEGDFQTTSRKILSTKQSESGTLLNTSSRFKVMIKNKILLSGKSINACLYDDRIEIVSCDMTVTFKDKMPHFPFNSPVAQIKATGTEFSLRISTTGDTIVEVLSGEIEVTTKSDKITRNFISGERVVINFEGFFEDNDQDLPQPDEEKNDSAESSFLDNNSSSKQFYESTSTSTAEQVSNQLKSVDDNTSRHIEIEEPSNSQNSIFDDL